MTIHQNPQLAEPWRAFQEGTLCRGDRFFGAHPAVRDGEAGYLFRVWAPNARKVCLMGNFNRWEPDSCPMEQPTRGLWEKFVPGLEQGELYKYAVHTWDGRMLAKSDPYAFYAELRPGTASRLYDLSGYQWGDGPWLARRAKKPIYRQPLNIYEVHLGSWRRTGEGEFLSYRDIAQWLVPYVKEMGFTHVELLPVTEHPLDASWGYQVTGYFAATSRFGAPHDLMYLIDQLHQAGVGVILDWVPAHFTKDAFGLYEFDGGPCYEYADPRKGEHYGWGTRVFNYGRNEVRSFLTSSALFWLEEYHADGLRVDAVASMLYLDYGRENGQWCPNGDGSRENWDAVSFLRHLNGTIFARHPDVLMAAEESTSWRHVTGDHMADDPKALGFNLKWNMGWMNDALHYQKMDPFFRQHHHKDLTFPLMYAFTENFILPISHDEVVHMKGSLLNKMPGTDEQKFAGLRAFYLYMLTQPGKKLLMMGSEFGQWNEWHYEYSLDWHLLHEEAHRKTQAFFRAANQCYLAQPALWEEDFSWNGFQWLCQEDAGGNILTYLRRDTAGDFRLAVLNFSPNARPGYRVGVPEAGAYGVLLSTDDAAFGGGTAEPPAPVESEPVPCHDQEESILLDLPPLSGMLLGCVGKRPRRGAAAAQERNSRDTADETAGFQAKGTDGK